MPTKKSVKINRIIKKEELGEDDIQIKQQDAVDTFGRADCDERDFNDDGGLSRKNKRKQK